jgi:hypothetical protein
MKNFRIIIPVLVIGIMSLAAAGSASAESMASANITMEPGDFTVGDPLPLMLTVNHPAGHEVILPKMEPNWGDFIVHSQSKGSTFSNPDGTETTTQLIDARLFSPGNFETPPLTLTLSDGSGHLSEITAQPVSVSITSILLEGDTDLRDIKPQAALPYVDYLPWILGLGILVMGIAAAYYLIRRRRKQLALAAIDNRLPHEVALDELERVENLTLPLAGKFKEHYTLVSDCIRIYMEKTYEFPVLERTTGEIRTNFKRTKVSTTIANQFMDLLDESDLVKFSKFIPDVPSARQVLTNGREIVELTKPVIVETGIDENQDQLTPPPTTPRFGKNGSNKNAEVTL